MDIIEVIKEPIFLVVSTILSLIISVMANVLTPKVLQLCSQLSVSLRDKQYAKKAIYHSKVVTAAHDTNRVVNIKLDAAYSLLRALIMIVFSLFLFSIATYFDVSVFFIAFSLALVTYAVSLFNNAQISYRIAVLAAKRAEYMMKIRTQINAKYQEQEYEDFIDPDEDAYEKCLIEWDKENI
ncbi:MULTISPECIES: hypothetical protein [unclassified Pseudoalteromonas]|uniref:hypothetical protein n=1 Tax=unclassified Pseudoalteromonas TaxID=194690 RepID=UPI0011086616|nr:MULTISPECIES: hypothetical protein [unclassified Pseudoalteromonas]MBB1432619.1 hypothetical protein [Pseudoalteromonas sp. SG43-4]TMN83753.1 hypothetical protein CWB64_07080 [Pseudoalteromonas sp. S410]TMN88896.1 hypothetical protein CWB62_14195 [Pseudoalteromonas sp. S408]TMN95301.1 hypothetical protein CWB63_18185 [Pseudoalteromonas sp. S409]TMN96101.1 hypothetical protein CWB61_13225 [Pseudoalteromonas sp. S407]